MAAIEAPGKQNDWQILLRLGNRQRLPICVGPLGVLQGIEECCMNNAPEMIKHGYSVTSSVVGTRRVTAGDRVFRQECTKELKNMRHLGLDSALDCRA